MPRRRSNRELPSKVAALKLFAAPADEGNRIDGLSNATANFGQVGQDAVQIGLRWRKLRGQQLISESVWQYATAPCLPLKAVIGIGSEVNHPVACDHGRSLEAGPPSRLGFLRIRVQAVVVFWSEFPEGLVEDDRCVFIEGPRLRKWLPDRPDRLNEAAVKEIAASIDSIAHDASAATTAPTAPEIVQTGHLE